MLSCSELTSIIRLRYAFPIAWKLGALYLHNPTESKSPSGILKYSINSSDTCSNDKQWLTSASSSCLLNWSEKSIKIYKMAFKIYKSFYNLLFLRSLG